MTDQPEGYSRPAITVTLSAGEKMAALRLLRSVETPHRIWKLINRQTLWAHQAQLIAEHLDKAAKQARPLSRDRRQASRLARRYRAAADAARQTPIVPAEWPEAPVTRPAPLTWSEATMTARWGVVPPPF